MHLVNACAVSFHNAMCCVVKDDWSDDPMASEEGDYTASSLYVH